MVIVATARTVYEDGNSGRLSLGGGDLLGVPDLGEQNLNFPDHFHISFVKYSWQKAIRAWCFMTAQGSNCPGIAPSVSGTVVTVH